MSETRLHALDGEPLHTFSKLARLLPARGDGGHADQSALHRWASRGVRVGDGRVYLEYVRVGSFRYSSSAALSRFLAKLNEPAATRPERSPAFQTPKQRRRAKAHAERRAAAVEKKLEALGV
jgi:hypothetical protein